MTGRSKVGLVALGAAALCGALSACSGGSAKTAQARPTSSGVQQAAVPSTSVNPAAVQGLELLPLIIKRPFGYVEAPTAGATGTITPAAFSRLGGAGSAAVAGYVVGYRENYVNSQTDEGLSVTVLKFSSLARADAFFKRTAPSSLSLVAPTSRPFTQVPGAVELDGTKAYQGEYQHGVVMTHNEYYASVVYVTAQPVTLPMEFYDWVKVQYLNLA